MPKEDDNASKNFGPHKDEEFILKEQDIEGDYRNLVDKSLDIRRYVRDGLLGRIP